MRHAEVDTQFIYIQTVDEAKHGGGESAGAIGHNSHESVDYIN
jgi:hypothetical protein